MRVLSIQGMSFSTVYRTYLNSVDKSTPFRHCSIVDVISEFLCALQLPFVKQIAHIVSLI
jgi:hypothetical protein